MITQNEFAVLLHCNSNSCTPSSEAESRPTQRGLSKSIGSSLGKANYIAKGLAEKGLITSDLQITDKGRKTLEQFKVKNAIIMAAGKSSRFVPLSFEKPKALLNVKGEVLIEREIRQLREAGITNITLVVGYLKEQLFYLEQKFGVKIVINEDYWRYNNTSSLIRVIDEIDSTYICSSDNYFTENPFEPYVYHSYYAAEYAEGKTDEYCLSTDTHGIIKKVTVGGQDSWYMIGHVYFDSQFSERFRKILAAEYQNAVTREELWENMYMRHIKELPLTMRKYDGTIKEFDSIEELRDFDTRFLDLTQDSKIFANIKKVLGAESSEIRGIKPIKSGMTNSSFLFTYKGQKYVYRHPGVGTSEYINRESEAFSQKEGHKVGLDDTLIEISGSEGWKLSHYLEGSHELDYHNHAEVSKALKMLSTLHTSGVNSGYSFDIWDEIHKFQTRLNDLGRSQFNDMQEMKDQFEELRGLIEGDAIPKVLCHCDSYSPNFIISKEGKMSLIDWEYSGMSDPGVDIGTFIGCSPFSADQAKEIIGEYLGHKATQKELAHYTAYVAAASYYWFLWAIWQESQGKEVGEWLLMWYRYAKQYADLATQLYSK